MPEKNWDDIEHEIFAAFSDVRLEDGIGYHEAGACDRYMAPDSVEYKQEKNKDTYIEWSGQLIEIRKVDFESGRHVFMDAKGLRFYLPFLMVRKEPELNDIMISYISEYNKRYGFGKSTFAQTYLLLTKAQRNCILNFYEYLTSQRYPFFTEDELNADLDTGEQVMKGFDYMRFMRERFS